MEMPGLRLYQWVLFLTAVSFGCWVMWEGIFWVTGHIHIGWR